MPTSLSPTGLCNIALSKIGAQAINNLTDLVPSAIACNTNFQLAYLEVSRASRWNCIVDTAILVQEVQTPLPTSSTITTAATWAPYTSYAANTYLTYGGYYYSVEFAYTSTNNFTNDLTTGALVQTNQPTTQPFFPNNGSQYPSGWAYKYALPADFQLLCALNDNTYWGYQFYGAGTNDYEIMGDSLFCDQAQAVVQYVKNQPDTTRFDSMLTNAIALKLASMIATQLRQDGGKMEAALLQGYELAVKQARMKNGGEKQARRFNPIGSSLFNRARYSGSNG